MPTIIEDEPSHEIYSSLFEGTTSQLSSSSFFQNKNNIDTIHNNNNNDENQFCKNVIVLDNPPIRTKVYQNNVVVSSSTMTRQGISMDCSNKGYQMLSKMGWNKKDGGLGKRRQGRMNPTSIVKHDKVGLGSFPPTNKTTSTVQKHSHMETKALKRRRQKEELEHKKKKEKQIRIMLRSDIPDNMEDLYLNLC